MYLLITKRLAPGKNTSSYPIQNLFILGIFVPIIHIGRSRYVRWSSGRSRQYSSMVTETHSSSALDGVQKPQIYHQRYVDNTFPLIVSICGFQFLSAIVSSSESTVAASHHPVVYTLLRLIRKQLSVEPIYHTICQSFQYVKNSNFCSNICFIK